MIGKTPGSFESSARQRLELIGWIQHRLTSNSNELVTVGAEICVCIIGLFFFMNCDLG